MASRVNLDGTLYRLGNTVTIIADGFAIRTENDACLESIDEKVYASKFGIYTAPPATVKQVRQDGEKHGDSLFDVVEECELEIYCSGDEQYLPTIIDNIYADDINYGVYDKDENVVYKVQKDETRRGQYNLIGVSKNTIKKKGFDALQTKLNKQYIPLIRIE